MMKRNKENKIVASSKTQKGKTKKKKPEPKPKTSILNVMKQTSRCDCEVVAKAVKSNVHTNLGLSDKRLDMGKETDAD